MCAAYPIYACQYRLFEERVWFLYEGTMRQSSIKQATPLEALRWCEKREAHNLCLLIMAA